MRRSGIEKLLAGIKKSDMNKAPQNGRFSTARRQNRRKSLIFALRWTGFGENQLPNELSAQAQISQALLTCLLRQCKYNVNTLHGHLIYNINTYGI